MNIVINPEELSPFIASLRTCYPRVGRHALSQADSSGFKGYIDQLIEMAKLNMSDPKVGSIEVDDEFVERWFPVAFGNYFSCNRTSLSNPSRTDAINLAHLYYRIYSEFNANFLNSYIYYRPN